MNVSARMAGLAGCSLLVVCLAPGLAQAQGDAAMKTNLAWQIALDRVGLSGGVIDGKAGPKTLLATREFQRARGLQATGQADAATAAALQMDPARALTTYTVCPQDQGEIGPAPKTWLEKARLPHLLYESLAALVGEKFHCSQACLGALNPGKNLASLKPGDTLNVPNVAADGLIAHGTRIEISFSEKVVRVKDDANHVVGLFPCSIAADKANLPQVRSTTVASITHDPTYRFDPEKWPEVKDVHRVLIIPSGPRNPVGLCWMGLALHGYGIHGTPAPDMIGKTGSHGCFRLTNWDAVRLSRMIREGTPVVFTAASAEGRSVVAAPGATGATVALSSSRMPSATGAPAPAAAPRPVAAAPARPRTPRTGFD